MQLGVRYCYLWGCSFVPAVISPRLKALASICLGFKSPPTHPGSQLLTACNAAEVGSKSLWHGMGYQGFVRQHLSHHQFHAIRGQLEGTVKLQLDVHLRVCGSLRYACSWQPPWSCMFVAPLIGAVDVSECFEWGQQLSGYKGMEGRVLSDVCSCFRRNGCVVAGQGGGWGGVLSIYQGCCVQGHQNTTAALLLLLLLWMGCCTPYQPTVCCLSAHIPLCVVCR